MSVDFSRVIPKPPTSRSELWVIDCKSGKSGFVAGVEVHVTASGCRVKRAAPIIGYMTGWVGRKVEEYTAKRGWKLLKYG